MYEQYLELRASKKKVAEEVTSEATVEEVVATEEEIVAIQE